MALTRFQISCLSACLALPILLLMKVIGGIDTAIGTFATGVVSLLVVFLIPKLYFRGIPPKHDPFYNGNTEVLYVFQGKKYRQVRDCLQAWIQGRTCRPYIRPLNIFLQDIFFFFANPIPNFFWVAPLAITP